MAQWIKAPGAKTGGLSLISKTHTIEKNDCYRDPLTPTQGHKHTHTCTSKYVFTFRIKECLGA